ncbi:hypothetical protein EB796_005895 [Bugula neritina]|uniref:Tyrosine-protein phosphatase domain-containing protein n=1 Tax=Bugula neritina TaxID=10212 RepID=A0A7J7KCY1_BUGNE|nr:hypothetical protein EB796_005895 [Bugula neritina]
MKGNSNKNRYTDIPCYDSTRVKLKEPTTTDYINANFVNGYKHKKAYICCQGPTNRTIVDFWNMVWQEEVRLIVMTTKYVCKTFKKFCKSACSSI